MQKINFEDLPSTRTPIDANNLNQLQTNIDNGKLDKTGGTINGNLTVTGHAHVDDGVEIFGTQPLIDFHYNNSSSDYTSRIIEESRGELRVTGNLKISGTTKAPNGIDYGSDNRVKFLWTGTHLDLYIDNTRIGRVTTTAN